MLGRTFSNFTKFGIEAGNGSRNLNLCFFSLFEKGCGRPRPFPCSEETNVWIFLIMTKSLILLIFHNFYEKNVLYHCCTKAKDQYEPSTKKIIHQFSQNMEGVWPVKPLFKKWKEAQIRVPGFIPSFYTKFCEIWGRSTQLLLAP